MSNEGDFSTISADRQSWAVARPQGPVVLVARVGAAAGARAAAAALACAASEPDRAALLVDLGGERPPRPSLIATAGARALEERLVAHLPDARIASRGQLCQLTVPANPEGVEQTVAALPLVRESAAVIHLPPSLLRALLEEPRVRPTAALLRADLSEDCALTALVVRDLIDHDLRVAVLKRPPAWLAARAALLGALPEGDWALPMRLCERLLNTEDKTLRQCYDGEDDSKNGREATRTDRSGP